MLVSAVIADAPPRRLLEHASGGAIELVIPTTVLDELDRVLRIKLGVPEPRREQIHALLLELCPTPAPPPIVVEARSGDDADDLILASALAAGADVLVTGDRKHLLPLAEADGMPIIQAQTIVAMLAR